MKKNGANYQAYLLRLWQEGANTPWRGSLEDPRSGRRELFPSLEALMEALQKRTIGKEQQKTMELQYILESVREGQTVKPIVVKVDDERVLEWMRDGLNKYKAAKERQSVARLTEISVPDKPRGFSLYFGEDELSRRAYEALTAAELVTLRLDKNEKGGLALIVNHEEQY